MSEKTPKMFYIKGPAATSDEDILYPTGDRFKEDLVGVRRMSPIQSIVEAEDKRTLELLLEAELYVPWSCDVCGKPGRKCIGPEGYCKEHQPTGTLRAPVKKHTPHDGKK